MDILELVEGKFYYLVVQEWGILSVKDGIRNIIIELNWVKRLSCCYTQRLVKRIVDLSFTC